MNLEGHGRSSCINAGLQSRNCARLLGFSNAKPDKIIFFAALLRLKSVPVRRPLQQLLMPVVGSNMTPSARLQAAIEILGELEHTPAPADRFIRE